MSQDPRLLALGVLLVDQQEALRRASTSIAWDFPGVKRKLEAIRLAMGQIVEELRQESGEEDPG